MSLTKFVQEKDVKERLRQEFQKPRFSVKKDLLAPPLTTRYSLVGTAFDYLLRFYVQYLNPEAVAKRWVAELSLTQPLSPLLTNVVVSSASGTIVSFTETVQTRRVQRIIEQAKRAHLEYLSSGEITDKLIKNTLLLAQLDPIYRARFVDENIGTVHKEDVADLRNLISIVDPDVFRARRLCLLNPTFGEASRLVGGADVDLVIDDTIIDVKTTKKLELRRQYFDQLMGYYVLHEVAGVGELRPKPEVTKVAIYFSRYAHMYVVELHEVIDRQAFPGFVRWFKDRASTQQAAV